MEERKVRELKPAIGKVVYRYETGHEAEEFEIDEQVFSIDFHTLPELINLLQKEKLNQSKESRNVMNVTVDSVVYTAESEDNKTKIETLMLEDMIFVELIQNQ